MSCAISRSVGGEPGIRCSKNRPVERLPWIMSTGAPSLGPESMYRMVSRLVLMVLDWTPGGRFMDALLRGGCLDDIVAEPPAGEGKLWGLETWRRGVRPGVVDR